MFTEKDITDGVKAGVRAYLLARTYAEVTRERIDTMERGILAETEYKADPKWVERGRPERITDPKAMYLMDLESPEYKEYTEECQARIKALGYDVPEGYCPACMAESLQTTAKHVLVHAGAEMMGHEPEAFDHELICAGLDKWHTYIDLLCRLVVNLPDFKNPLTEKAMT